MEDKFSKYVQLYIRLFFCVLAIPVFIAILFAIFYGFSTLIASRITNLIFELVIANLPPAVFTTAYLIFFKRTTSHPSNIVRIISKLFFVCVLIYNVYIVIMDLFIFFRNHNNNITDYLSYNLLFLTINIGGLFLIAIMQALTTNEEEDWMKKK